MSRLSRFFTAPARAGGRSIGRLVGIEQIRSHGDDIATMARTVAGWRHGSGRSETFLNAVRRRGLTPADLAQLHRQHVILAMVCGGFAALGLGLGLAALLRGVPVGILGALGAVAFLGALFAKHSFRAYQIEIRELVPFQAWFCTPSAWLPCWHLLDPDASRAIGWERRHD